MDPLSYGTLEAAARSKVVEEKYYYLAFFLNGTEIGEAKGPNDLQKAFGGYLAVASMVPNVTFLILNAFFGHRFKTQPRLIVSLIFVIIVFAFTSVMVMVDTDTWQSEFLTLTLVSVVFININTAIFQVCSLN